MATPRVRNTPPFARYLVEQGILEDHPRLIGRCVCFGRHRTALECSVCVVCSDARKDVFAEEV